jgi:DNA repair exonuclease SbcCD ATPase subunit
MKSTTNVLLASALLFVANIAFCKTVSLDGVTREDDRNYVSQKISSNQNVLEGQHLIDLFQKKWGMTPQGRADWKSLNEELEQVKNSPAYKKLKTKQWQLSQTQKQVEEKDKELKETAKKVETLETQITSIQQQAQNEIGKIYNEWAQSVANIIRNLDSYFAGQNQGIEGGASFQSPIANPEQFILDKLNKVEQNLNYIGSTKPATPIEFDSWKTQVETLQHNFNTIVSAWNAAKLNQGLFDPQAIRTIDAKANSIAQIATNLSNYKLQTKEEIDKKVADDEKKKMMTAYIIAGLGGLLFGVAIMALTRKKKA